MPLEKIAIGKVKYRTNEKMVNCIRYASRGYGCGIYSEFIFVDIKALKCEDS
jgi:hypothetical protein